MENINCISLVNLIRINPNLNTVPIIYGSEGVLANNDTTALVLLRFLCIIIDNRTYLLMEDLFYSLVREADPKTDSIFLYNKQTVKDGEQMAISDIINKIAIMEKSYTYSYVLNQSIAINFIEK